LGHITEYQERDGNGRPTKVADANGILTQMTYHPRGWLETRTVKGVGGAPDAVTAVAYDDAGNVTRVTQPDGAYLAYGYDIAHRLTSITDNRGTIPSTFWMHSATVRRSRPTPAAIRRRHGS
jgi:YD repeat-containing protein